MAFTYIFLANAWLGDDSYITFRVVWNTLHGYGPVFNVGERVQAYTHPLWMLLIMAAHAVTREFFFTALAVCYGFSLAAVLVTARSAGSVAAASLAFIWLVSSKAFVDYTSSGLENPLSYLLLALFYVRFLRLGDDVLSARDLQRLGLLAGLAFVNRMDSVLLYAPALTWLTWRAWRRTDERVWPLLAGFGVPAAAWLVFATIYYGFPLPNTYYAKVATGIPSGLLYRQGLAYLLNSVSRDPITLGTVMAAILLAVRAAMPVRLASASALLYIAYTISIGGDFMSGRFFAMPFMVALLSLLPVLSGIEHAAPAAALLIVYNLFVPLAPVKTTADYDAGWPWRSQNGVKDERGHYHRLTNVLFYSPFRELPDHQWVREGRSFKEGRDKVTVQGSIGYYGLEAGPEKHIVDRNALSDPLLARLPVSRQLYFEFYVGHYFRDLPDGYLQSISEGRNLLTDPLLHTYYDRLVEVIRGPLLSPARLRSIWYLNLGKGRHFAHLYDAARPVELSVRAANERFLTDVGNRDLAAGTLRSTGRAGFLQAGPGIPMKAGGYRVRWIGALAGSVTGSVGFVDVLADGDHVARHEITTNDAVSERHQLAEIPFTLNSNVQRLEYRFWIQAGAPVVLERVELSGK